MIGVSMRVTPKIFEPALLELLQLLRCRLDTADHGHPAMGERLLNHISGGTFNPEFQTLWLLHPFTLSNKWNGCNSHTDTDHCQLRIGTTLSRVVTSAL